MTDRFEVKFLGGVIGTATGWDQASDFGIQFYDFLPSDNLPFTLTGLAAVSCLCMDPFESSQFVGIDDAGSEVYSIRVLLK